VRLMLKPPWLLDTRLNVMHVSMAANPIATLQALLGMRRARDLRVPYTCHGSPFWHFWNF
jgi:hypothetical protein